MYQELKFTNDIYHYFRIGVIELPVLVPLWRFMNRYNRFFAFHDYLSQRLVQAIGVLFWYQFE